MDNSFSFHCTICFEALDSAKRAPVVLPCGHTFICQQCSSRLDKCMECRHSLFVTVEGKQPEFVEEIPRRRERYNSLPFVQPTNPESKDSARFTVEKKRLPTPKNTVLISLMESSRWSERDNCKEDKIFEDQDDNAFVNEGIEQLHCEFGTYAVREREGLAICEITKKEASKAPLVKQSRDSKQKKEIEQDHNQSMDLSDVFELQSMIVTEDSFDTLGHVSTEIKLLENSDNDQEKLEYGRTVQVVKFENGKAQLARGAGSLEVKPGQLVKVGAARDKACQIEGRMLSLEKQREEIRLKMKEIERDISNLSKELPEAVALPFIDSIVAESELVEEEEDEVSIATTATLSSVDSYDLNSSCTWNSFIDDAANFYTSSRQQADQERTLQSQSFSSNPMRRSPEVDFNSGFSGYGFSGHRTSPRRQPKRTIRRMSAY